MSCSAQPQVYHDEARFTANCGSVSSGCGCRKGFFRYRPRCCTGDEVSHPQDLSPSSAADQLAALTAAIATVTAADFDASGVEVELNIMDLPTIEALSIADTTPDTATLSLVAGSSAERLFLSVAADSASAAADLTNGAITLTLVPAAGSVNDGPDETGVVAFLP